MNVLHLPTNIASQVSITVRALNGLGVNAIGLVKNNAITQEGEGIIQHQVPSRKRYPIRGMIKTFTWWADMYKYLRWADIIHWHFGSTELPFNLDLKYIAALKKTAIIEFWGSDIRIPSIAIQDNIYIRKVFNENPVLAHKAEKKSIDTQRKFANHGFSCLIPGSELGAYIRRDIFPHYRTIRQRIPVHEFHPKFPNPDEKCPVVVHSPSSKAIKGTSAVMQAVDSLRKKYEFKFKLIHDVEHSRALEMISDCDIMLDQFCGGDHGLAALEAMAFGKPTLCYIKPSCLEKYPDELPIVNANVDTLSEVLERLLKDGQRRFEIGRKSRLYVEKYHDAHEIARQLVDIYEELLSKKKN